MVGLVVGIGGRGEEGERAHNKKTVDPVEPSPTQQQQHKMEEKEEATLLPPKPISITSRTHLIEFNFANAKNWGVEEWGDEMGLMPR